MARTQVTPEEDDILRKALFVPCTTKEDLHQWICIYLGLNLPDTKVDPDSTSSPMDAVWEIYHKGMMDNDPDFSRVMAYAARDSMKTLGAAVLEVLMVLHQRRDVAHMAAIKPQARKAQSYVKKAFRMPYLRDYATGNTEQTDIVWYEDKSRNLYLTKAQYEALPESAKDAFEEQQRYIKIVVATMAGANSDHVSFFCVDEVDVIPKHAQAAYEEAKSIPGIGMHGEEPITLLISSRKFAFGNVQREIVAADSTGLQVRHWNIIDVTERCPPSRHLPERPRIPIYVSNSDLEYASKEELEKMPDEKRDKFKEYLGYEGCVTKCKLFAACKGHLATRQKFHPKTEDGKKWAEDPRPLLKTIRFTTTKFKELTLDRAKAQLMCWEASSEGLIYPDLDEGKHLISPARAAHVLTGEEFSDEMTFDEFYKLTVKRGGKWLAGIDHGHTHLFTVSLLYVEGQRGMFMGYWYGAEMSPDEKIALLRRTIEPLNPKIYPDTADKTMNQLLKKAKFRIQDWSKGAGSVLSGIEDVRYQLRPGMMEPPNLYFVKGAPNIDDLFTACRLYHWALDDEGRPGKEPDEIVARVENGVITDDGPDCARYVVMNAWKRGQGISVGGSANDEATFPKPSEVASSQRENADRNRLWAQQIMAHVMGGAPEDHLQSPEDKQKEERGRKGSLLWDM